MAVTDDLRAIAERADRGLDAVHDFFEHSKFVWVSFKNLVDQGHRTSTENQATGTRIDQDGLLRLAPQYTRDYLTTFTFRQFVSAFEAFLFNFLHRLLLHNPWPFAQRQLDFRTVLEAASRDEIISGVILKQLNELKYEQLREWFVAINKALKLDCPTEDEIDTLGGVQGHQGRPRAQRGRRERDLSPQGREEGPLRGRGARRDRGHLPPGELEADQEGGAGRHVRRHRPAVQIAALQRNEVVA